MASGDILTLFGTAKVWGSGLTPTEDFTISLGTLLTGTGRQGAVWDRGAAAFEDWINLEIEIKANATPTIGSLVRVYLAVGRVASTLSGNLGNTDAAVSVETLIANCVFLGAVEMDEASMAKPFRTDWDVNVGSARYIVPAVFNASGVSLHATSTNHKLTLTPFKRQIQP